MLTVYKMIKEIPTGANIEFYTINRNIKRGKLISYDNSTGRAQIEINGTIEMFGFDIAEEVFTE